ncbi:MAG: hypothetical protein HRU19_02220 [Pseudobacteriovorax sp.]|nr:hypothetical protein [Pseudobacteriovorax sp.]
MKLWAVIAWMTVHGFLSTACHNETKSEAATTEEPQQGSDSCDEPVFSVSYKEHIEPIVLEHCVKCHDESAAETAGKPWSSFVTYEGARDWGYLMPGFRLFAELNAADQEAIRNWIAGGLTEETYNTTVKSILDANCVSCHSEIAPSRKGKPSTSFYLPDVVRQYGSQFPSFGNLKNVGLENERLLEEWVNQGLPMD